jgi:hypothetical protein
MSSSNPFAEYYKTITDSALLAILDNPQDYQASAIDAAKAELESRQLSESAILEARQPLLEKEQAQAAEREKRKMMEEKLKAAGTSLFDSINPMEQGIPTTDKMIRRIVIVLGVLYLYELISNFSMHLSNLKDLPEHPFELGLYFVLLLILPVALIFFWKRKPIGWILLAIYLVFSLVATLWFFFFVFKIQSSTILQMRDLIPESSLLTHLFQLLLFSGAIYILTKKEMRETYLISTDRAAAIVIISGLVSFLIVYGMS